MNEELSLLGMDLDQFKRTTSNNKSKPKIEERNIYRVDEVKYITN